MNVNGFYYTQTLIDKQATTDSLGAFSRVKKTRPVSFAMYVFPHVKSRETLNGLSRNVILGSFTKI